MATERERADATHTPAGAASAPQKEPDEWVTGDEAMTKAQASYLKTLAAEAGETFDSGLSKAEASKRIEQLQRKTGRGQAKADGGDGGNSIRANEAEPKPSPRHE
jgi:hypothetical protein